MSFPERIVCLTEETVETLYLLGEQARIVGVTGYAVRPPEVRREKPRVGAFTSADVPKIAGGFSVSGKLGFASRHGHSDYLKRASRFSTMAQSALTRGMSGAGCGSAAYVREATRTSSQ